MKEGGGAFLFLGGAFLAWRVPTRPGKGRTGRNASLIRQNGRIFAKRRALAAEKGAQTRI
jgi:hypothetical protein